MTLGILFQIKGNIRLYIEIYYNFAHQGDGLFTVLKTLPVVTK